MGTNRVAFLTFVELMVLETNEKNPLTRHQIQRKMEDAGYFLDVRTIRDFIEDAILAGLDIRSRAEPGEERGARRYWYAGGWI